MSLQRIKAIAIADLKSLWREKAVIFWAVIWPVLMVFISAYVFVPPETGSLKTFMIGVVDLDEGFGNFSGGRLLIDLLRNISYFKVVIYNSTEDLMKDLEKAEVDIGIIIPENFSRNLVFETADLYVYVSGSDPQSLQINRGFAQAFFYHFERETAVEKARRFYSYFQMYQENFSSIYIPEINMSMSEIVNKTLVGIATPINIFFEDKIPRGIIDRSSIVGWMTIGALGMTMLYSGLSFGATAVIIEKERGRLDRMIATGVKAQDLFFGKMISAGAILLAASVIVIIIGKILGAKIVWNIADFRYWLVPLNLFLVFLMTLSIGFMLSLISKSSRSAGTLGIVLGLLLSFTTGIWIPDFMLPEPMRVLAHSFPVTWALDLIRGIMVFNRDINMLISSQIKIVISTIFLIALGIIAYRKVISRYVEIV